jgi:hypothetical protein
LDSEGGESRDRRGDKPDARRPFLNRHVLAP